MNKNFKNWKSQLPADGEDLLMWVKRERCGDYDWETRVGYFVTTDHYDYEEGEERMKLPCFIDSTFTIEDSNLYPYYYVDEDKLINIENGEAMDVYWMPSSIAYGSAPVTD